MERFGLIMYIWKKHKKAAVIIISLVLILAVLLTAGLLAAGRVGGGAALPDDALANTTTLAKTGLVDSVSLSGTVQSANSQNVYSTLNNLVEEVHVELGDSVSAGALLARLDTAALELEIAQQQARMRHNSGMDAELFNAEAALKTAELDLRNKAAILEENTILFEGGYISGLEMEQARTNHQLAQSTYDRAVSSLNATRNRINQENDIQQIVLQRLEKNLADSLIKAPLDGTVTAVHAEPGSPGSGLLFVIENTQNLMITAFVKEYDMGRIRPGQEVTIRSDATADAQVRGEVTGIAPTSIKSAAGETIVSSPAEFAVEIAVLDQETGLKVGMNARLEIILEKKSDVYAVPYSAVGENAQGQSVIYAIIQENGRPRIKELPVERGMETDFHVEVRGDGLADGIIILNDADAAN